MNGRVGPSRSAEFSGWCACGVLQFEERFEVLVLGRLAEVDYAFYYAARVGAAKLEFSGQLAATSSIITSQFLLRAVQLDYPRLARSTGSSQTTWRSERSGWCGCGLSELLARRLLAVEIAAGPEAKGKAE